MEKFPRSGKKESEYAELLRKYSADITAQLISVIVVMDHKVLSSNI
jgi:hypothetical protein